MLLVSAILVLITAILLVAQVVLYVDSSMAETQLSPLEAGFESLVLGYAMSSPFMFLAILFVLFDLELLLLLPGLLFMESDTIMFYIWLGLMMFVLQSLLVEWALFGLKWSIY